jgi:hypothetical protein
VRCTDLLHHGRNPPRSNYSDSQRSLQTSGPSPPYVKPSPPVEETYHNREPIYPVQDTPRDATAPRPQLQEQAQSQPQQQQPPSPRKSIFDFVSPFDALAASGSNKKKPVPQPGSSSSGNEDSWTNASISDQKENVMDTFNRAPVSHPNLQAQPVGYDVYTSTDELSQTESGPLGGLTGLLSSKATDMPDPHKASPPKAQGPRHQHRATESPVGAGQSPNLPPPNRRENRDSGSLSRGSWKGGKPTGQKPKSHTSPTCVLFAIAYDRRLKSGFPVVNNLRISCLMCPSRWTRSKLRRTPSSRPRLRSSSRTLCFCLVRLSVQRTGWRMP